MSLVLETQADGTEPIVISSVINSLLTVLHLGEAALTVNATREISAEKFCENVSRFEEDRSKAWKAFNVI